MPDVFCFHSYISGYVYVLLWHCVFFLILHLFKHVIIFEFTNILSINIENVCFFLNEIYKDIRLFLVTTNCQLHITSER